MIINQRRAFSWSSPGCVLWSQGNISMMWGFFFPCCFSLQSILNTTEEIGYKVVYTARNTSVITTSLALLVLRPDPSAFGGLAFGVTSYDSGVDLKVRPKYHLRDHWLNQTVLLLFHSAVYLTGGRQRWACHLSLLQISVQENPFKKALASVFLPESLKKFLGIEHSDPDKHSKIQFKFFGTTSLFEVTTTRYKC